MLYEIVNPSDPYTIEAKTLDVAFVACVFLGSGRYAFAPLEEGVKYIPMFMFGGSEKWCREHFSESLESVVDRVTTDPAKRAELAECFESCLIGDLRDRTEYHKWQSLIDDPAKREKLRTERHDARRSSMNDIGGRAYEIAANLRAGAKNVLVAAPRQVFSS